MFAEYIKKILTCVILIIFGYANTASVNAFFSSGGGTSHSGTISGARVNGNSYGNTRSGAQVSVTTFSSGNFGANVTGMAPPMSGRMSYSYANSNGTYSTVRYFGGSTNSRGSGGGSGGGGGGVSTGDYYNPCTSGGEILYQGSCYPKSSCTYSAADGKGGRTVTCSTPPAEPTNPERSNNLLPSAANPPASPVLGIVIAINPPIIRAGASATLTWDGGSSDTCTVTGPSAFLDTRVTGESEVTDIFNESSYVLSCIQGALSDSATATVRVLPRIQET